MLTETLKGRSRQVLERNWNGSHTRPSPPHYPDAFLWDSGWAAVINARRGEPERAAIELKTILEGEDSETGFIPNRRLIGPINWRDLESWTFTEWGRSNYTQPPILPHAALEVYNSLKRKGQVQQGEKFLQAIYGETQAGKLSGLKGTYEYFGGHRENGNGSKLIGVIHPYETGRDSDPSLQQGAFRIPHKGIIAKFTPLAAKTIPLINTAIDYGRIAKHNIRARIHGWKPKEVRDIYWVNDVMVNVIYANNLRDMSRISNELSNTKDSSSYSNLAEEVEKEILEKMWSQDNGFFYNLDKNGNQIPIASISGLFPLTLEGISQHQLSSLLDKLESPDWFDTPYPIPSLPVNSQFYDPHYDEKRMWRGPVWINLNFLIAEEGIAKQLERFKDNEDLSRRLLGYLDHLVTKTEELAEKSGFREFYDPESGKGYRVKDFTWSILALFLDKSKALLARRKNLAVAS